MGGTFGQPIALKLTIMENIQMMNYVLKEKDTMTEEKYINLISLDKKAMGVRIRSRREAKALSREKLAEYLSVSSQFIADIEYGNKGISLEKFYLLAQALGVTTDYLLGGNIYSQKKEPEYQEIHNQIIEMLKCCDAHQLKMIYNITEIFVESLKSK
jgi:transcriptional regulator with XRE-family HTH domain